MINDSAMRIVHYLHHYPEFCGTTLAVHGLARALAGCGHDVTIYCSSEGPAEEFTDGLRIRRFAVSPHLNFRIPSDMQTALRENQDEIDLLVVHGIFNPRNVAATHAAKRGGIPYVVCPHGLHSRYMLQSHRVRKLIYGSLWERPMLDSAAAVHAFSQYQAGILRDFRVRAPIFVAPNGLNPEEVPESLKPVGTNAALQDAHLLFLGRLDPFVKGLDLLLAAFAKALGRRSLPAGTMLDLVGPGEAGAVRLSADARRLGIWNAVRLPGPVRPQDRWMTLASCGLFVLPSRHDAFPSAVLEAMLLGKPVLVSAETGVAEIVGAAGCGFLVEPTVDSIASGLVNALAERNEWPELGSRGQLFAQKQLRWEFIGAKVGAFYREALSRSGVVEAILS